MTSGSIARRYGRALFDVAVREADPEAVGRELGELVDLVEGNAELSRVLAHPAVPTRAKRGVVAALLERGSPISPIVSKLLLLLADRDRLGLLGAIGRVYDERLLAHRQIVRAEVTTAVPLSAERAEAIERGLSEVTGTRVTLETKVDPAIIGGVVARLGSVIYDGSVTRQLDRLQAKLSDG